MDLLEQYKDIKEIADLIQERKDLREYYSTQQYDKMQEHISFLTAKYALETFVWNSKYKNMPVTVHQSYINAENFLRSKGIAILAQYSIKVQELVLKVTGISFKANKSRNVSEEEAVHEYLQLHAHKMWKNRTS